MTNDPLRHLAAAGLQITAVHGREDTIGIPPKVVAALEAEQLAGGPPFIDPRRAGIEPQQRAPNTFCGVCGTLLEEVDARCPVCFPTK